MQFNDRMKEAMEYNDRMKGIMKFNKRIEKMKTNILERRSRNTRMTKMKTNFLTLVILTFLFGSGYFVNIYKCTELDFQPQYKAEIFRVIGICFPPAGVVIGWVTFDEEK